MTKAFAMSCVIALSVVACAVEQDELNGGRGGPGGENGGMAGGENAPEGHGTGTGGEEGTGTVPGATPAISGAA